MTIKQLKKELGLNDKQISEFFGYKNAMSYYNAKNGKTKLENGLVKFYEHVLHKVARGDGKKLYCK